MKSAEDVKAYNQAMTSLTPNVHTVLTPELLNRAGIFLQTLEQCPQYFQLYEPLRQTLLDLYALAEENQSLHAALKLAEKRTKDLLNTIIKSNFHSGRDKIPFTGPAARFRPFPGEVQAHARVMAGHHYIEEMRENQAKRLAEESKPYLAKVNNAEHEPLIRKVEHLEKMGGAIINSLLG